MTEAVQNTVRALLTLASVLGLCGSVWVTLAVIGYSGFPQGTADRVALLYPCIYLPATIYLCWSDISRRALLTLGVLLNLPVVAALVYAFAVRGVPGIVVCAVFLVLWIARLL
jgi:hypothetical protein